MKGKTVKDKTVNKSRLFLLAMILPLAAFGAGNCADSRDLRLVNGKIVTMDARNSVLSSVTIQNGRFDFSGGKLSPCTKTINLHGRTAVPGLIDNHNHIVLLGIRPGYDTRLETAASIKDVQAAIAARAKAGSGWEIHHRHGRMESGAVRRKAPADARGAGRGSAGSSGAVIPSLHRSCGHQHLGQSILRGEGNRGERGGRHCRERTIARGIKRSALHPDLR